MANWRKVSAGELCEAHLARPAPTRRAYGKDLDAFAAWLGCRNRIEAVKRVAADRADAHRMLMSYKASLRTEGKALATVRRRISSIRGMLSTAKELGIITWDLPRMRLPSPTPARDVSGPSREAIMRMISVCEQRHDAKGARDKAIVLLMFTCGLRSAEVLSIDYPRHVRPGRYPEVSIAAKGEWERQTIALPLRTAAAIERWIEHRGQRPGRLFTSLDKRYRNDGDRPLTYRGLYEALAGLGELVGERVHPHGLRHAAASEIDRLTRGSITWIMALTRHQDPKQALAYTEARKRAMRNAAEIIAAGQFVEPNSPEMGRW